MGLPLALLVAVGLALSSPGAAELQRGERRREDQGGPQERLYLGVVTLPAQTLGRTTGVRVLPTKPCRRRVQGRKEERSLGSAPSLRQRSPGQSVCPECSAFWKHLRGAGRGSQEGPAVRDPRRAEAKTALLQSGVLDTR